MRRLIHPTAFAVFEGVTCCFEDFLGRRERLAWSSCNWIITGALAFLLAAATTTSLLFAARSTTLLLLAPTKISIFILLVFPLRGILHNILKKGTIITCTGRPRFSLYIPFSRTRSR